MPRTPGVKPILSTDANAQERAAQALRLRIAGMSQQAIADQVGLSQSRISRVIKQALRAQYEGARDDLRALEMLRSEELHHAMWPKALRGDTSAAHVVIKASERRARLYALDEASESSAGAGGAAWLVQVYVRVTVGAGDVARATVDAAAHAAIADAVDAAQTATPALGAARANAAATPGAQGVQGVQVRARMYEHRYAADTAASAVVEGIQGPYALPYDVIGDSLAYNR